VDATNGEVELDRLQSIMSGGDYCHFRFLAPFPTRGQHNRSRL